ncbi:hypothetical protein HPB48_021901 [Haemaphysalis longicornis]|uniref:DDE-1 domain-containing protein n=1 Tax=Haemaphysalis longicornis TaxID=44386 RepID=A0A9J6GI83_HAELO|nr:hypothetical protein HPB48_021901 [Haemaphysalis longicornis]
MHEFCATTKSGRHPTKSSEDERDYIEDEFVHILTVNTETTTLFLNFSRVRGAPVVPSATGCWLKRPEKIADNLKLGNFAESSQYIKTWKARFGFTMRQEKNDSQKTPDYLAEAASAFRSAFNALRLRHDFTPTNIANIDQTMVRIDNPAGRTNNVAAEATVRIANTACARRGFTVALAACANGDKLPAFVIFKEPSGKIPAKAFIKLRIPARRRLLEPAIQGSASRFVGSLRLEGRKTAKGNLRKPSRQEALCFVSEACAAVSEETVARSFKRCGIFNPLDGSGDGDLHEQLSSVGAVDPDDRGPLQVECMEMIFATDSDESFDGFASHDD